MSPYGDVVRETDGSGIETASYILSGTELLSQKRSGVVSFYLHDGQDSTRTLINSSGNITGTYVYDAFGNLSASTGTMANVYHYTGQQFDAATGLYNLRARYYDSSTGRFLSKDTQPLNINTSEEINRYLYAMGNVVNNKDSSGNTTTFPKSRSNGNDYATLIQTL